MGFPSRVLLKRVYCKERYTFSSTFFCLSKALASLFIQNIGLKIHDSESNKPFIKDIY
jgi:hypothetical protein